VKAKAPIHEKKRAPPMLRKSNWRRHLHPGDEVTWNDPDGGACSRIGTLLSIRYFGDDSASITFTDGWCSEVLLNELS